ncbi:MAG: hypothetical protein ACC707_04060 [Thiohalomonadales bacterium]
MYQNMDLGMLGTWHYEFWHLGIGMVIIVVGILAMIAAYIYVPEVKDQMDH